MSILLSCLKNIIMGLLNHLLLDHFAQEKNWLTDVEVRTKLFYIGTGLILNICAQNCIVPLILLTSTLILLTSIRIPLKHIALRMLLPMLFGIFIFFIMSLHRGDTVLFSGSLFRYEFSLREEGLLHGLLLFSKILGGVMLLLLLSFTTSITKICAAARWMKIPETLVETLSFVYRYIFLLMNETETMMSSQRSRLGYSSWFRTIRSFGSLGGMLIIRSITRAENAHTAMISRGYDGGRIFSIPLPPFGMHDYVILFSSALFLISLFTVTLII